MKIFRTFNAETRDYSEILCIFAPLRDKAMFDRFDLDGWTVCWLDGTIDIAPEHLYELGVAA